MNANAWQYTNDVYRYTCTYRYTFRSTYLEHLEFGCNQISVDYICVYYFRGATCTVETYCWAQLDINGEMGRGPDGTHKFTYAQIIYIPSGKLTWNWLVIKSVFFCWFPRVFTFIFAPNCKPVAQDGQLWLKHP